MNFIRNTYRVSSKITSFKPVEACRNQNRFLVSHYSSEPLKPLHLKDVVAEVEDKNHFQTLLDSPYPVIIDFYATWCGPCLMLTPKLEEVCKNDRRFKLLKVNIDKVPDVAQEFSVSSVPTVFAVYKQEKIRHFIGFQNNPGLVDFLKSVAEKIGFK